MKMERNKFSTLLRRRLSCFQRSRRKAVLMNSRMLSKAFFIRKGTIRRKVNFLMIKRVNLKYHLSNLIRMWTLSNLLKFFRGDCLTRTWMSLTSQTSPRKCHTSRKKAQESQSTMPRSKKTIPTGSSAPSAQQTCFQTPLSALRT